MLQFNLAKIKSTVISSPLLALWQRIFAKLSPLVIMAWSYIVGIFCYTWLPVLGFWPLVILAPCTVYIIRGLIQRNFKRKQFIEKTFIGKTFIGKPIFLLIIFSLGYSLSAVYVKTHQPPDDFLRNLNQRVELVGIISGEPSSRAATGFNLKIIQLAGQSLKNNYTVRVSVTKGKNNENNLALSDFNEQERALNSLNLKYGDKIKLNGKLSIPQLPGNPGEFNYRNYLERQGIYLVFKAQQQDVILLARNQGNPLMQFVLGVKASLVDNLSSGLRPDQRALIGGMIFGGQGSLTDEVRDDFQDTGLVHILSVSGFHVGFLIWLLVAIAAYFNLSRKTAFWTTAVVLIAYALMTGISPPVIRATVMGFIGMLAVYMGRKQDYGAVLALAALLYLVFCPFELFNPGFQLSYAATWAILTFGLPLMDYVKEKGYSSYWQLAVVPLTAQLGVIPLVAYHFNQVSVISLFANIISADLIALEFYLGLASALLGFITPWIPWILNLGLGMLLDITTWLVHVLAILPGAVITVGTPGVLGIAGYYLVWFVITVYVKERQDYLKDGLGFWQMNMASYKLGTYMLLPLLLLGVNFGLNLGEWLLTPRLTVNFLSVGQGDAIFIEIAGGTRILVDCGDRNEFTDMGQKVILPYLRHKGITALDGVVLTHLHQDHVGGLESLLSEIDVKQVITVKRELLQNVPETAGAYERLAVLLMKQKVRWTEVTAGQKVFSGKDAEIIAVYPIEAIQGTRSDVNNRSLVLQVTSGQDSLLLPGDLEAEGMEKLLVDADEKDLMLKGTFIKVPHHGSKYSINQKFYQRIGALGGVISVGPNLFGHPAQEVLSEFQAMDLKIWRTDLHGAVTASTNSDGWRVESFK